MLNSFLKSPCVEGICEELSPPTRIPKIGEYWTMGEAENPFLDVSSTTSCIIKDVRDGWVQYQFINRFTGQPIMCRLNSAKISKFIELYTFYPYKHE